MDFSCNSIKFYIDLIMTDYKAIHGKNILHVASDLDDAEGEGQVWFNTTSSDYKTIVKVAGAWATGTALNTSASQGSRVPQFSPAWEFN